MANTLDTTKGICGRGKVFGVHFALAPGLRAKLGRWTSLQRSGPSHSLAWGGSGKHNYVAVARSNAEGNCILDLA